ncbi:MAG: response regulator [Gammaproteobacteria bacterium]|nr:response regulator [Gammaproteobacteria bacterium]
MKSVLVVDDSLSMRGAVRLILETAGYQATEAIDGQDGLAKAGGARFDLVISDINMPVMDGYAMIAALRALPDYRFTPILMLTTESSSDAKKKGKAAGATGWIVKPFNPEQLVATVQKILS